MDEIRPGDGKPWRQFDKPSSEILNTFDNPKLGRNYEVLFESREVTALCPLTEAPDFYTLSIKYIPHIRCIESKSAKLYFGSWRNYGAFIETMANQIMDDWVKACAPVSAVLTLTMAPRGGIPITVTVPYKSPV